MESAVCVTIIAILSTELNLDKLVKLRDCVGASITHLVSGLSSQMYDRSLLN